MKKNIGLIIFTIILLVLVLVLGNYIIYDKLFNKDTDISNTNTSNKDNYDTLFNDLKEKFVFTAEYYEMPKVYCGETEGSVHLEELGYNYYKSTQFNSYDERTNYLKQYMSENVIEGQRFFTYGDKYPTYYEKDGNLYCITTAKGNPYLIYNRILEIKSISSDTITAKGITAEYIPDYSDDNFINNTYDYIIYNIKYEKIDNKWIITSFETLFDSSIIGADPS